MFLLEVIKCKKLLAPEGSSSHREDYFSDSAVLFSLVAGFWQAAKEPLGWYFLMCAARREMVSASLDISMTVLQYHSCASADTPLEDSRLLLASNDLLLFDLWMPFLLDGFLGEV